MPPRRRRTAGKDGGGKKGIPGRKKKAVGGDISNAGAKKPPPETLQQQISSRHETSRGSAAKQKMTIPSKRSGGRDVMKMNPPPPRNAASKKASSTNHDDSSSESEEEFNCFPLLKQPQPLPSQHNSLGNVVTTNKKTTGASSIANNSDISDDNNSNFSPSSNCGAASSSAAVGGMQHQHLFCSYRSTPVCSNNSEGLRGCEGDVQCMNYLHESCMVKLERQNKVRDPSLYSYCMECHPVFGQSNEGGGNSSSSSGDELDDQKPRATNNNSKKKPATKANKSNNNNHQKSTAKYAPLSSDEEEEEEEGCGYCEEPLGGELEDCYHCQRSKCVHLQCMEEFLEEHDMDHVDVAEQYSFCVKCVKSHEAYQDLFCCFADIGMCLMPKNEEKVCCTKCPPTYASQIHPSCFVAFHREEASPWMIDGEQCCHLCYEGEESEGTTKPTSKNKPTSKQQTSQKFKACTSSNSNATSVSGFLAQFGEGNNANGGDSSIDRLGAIASQYEKAINLEGNRLGKVEKLKNLRAVAAQRLDTMLKGEYLTIAKPSFEALKRILKGSNVTIKSIALSAMQLGKCLHEINCEDETCVHCEHDEKEHAPIRHKVEVRLLRECFENCSLAVLAQETKDKEKERKSTQKASNASTGKVFKRTMFTLTASKFPTNFRYNKNMTDDEPCPVCNHCYVQKLHSAAEYAAEDKRLEKEYQQRMALWNSLRTKTAKEAAGMKTQPRRVTKSKIPQKHICICYQLSGRKCPACKGNAPKMQDPHGQPGDEISSCPVCQCSCCVGPFKNEDRPDVHEQYQLYCKDKGKPTTVSEHSNPGVENLSDMARVALQNGERDLRLMGKRNISEDDVQGAAVPYFNEMHMNDNTRHHASQTMGEPTNLLGGRNIQHHQRQRAQNGRRFYVVGQSQQQHQQYQQLQQHAQQQQPEPQQQATHHHRRQQQSSSPKGVSVKRVKSRLKHTMLRGTPDSRVAAEGVSTDIRTNRDSTAMDHIMEAQHESEPEAEFDDNGNEVTPSQQIANEAVLMKKLEFDRKRKERS